MEHCLLCGSRFVTSWSPNLIEPWFGVTKPASERSSVVLPQPEGPRRKNRLP